MASRTRSTQTTGPAFDDVDGAVGEKEIEGGRFVEVRKSAGPAFDLLEVSRGAALGDIDNDGDVDILVTNNGGPARLLLSERFLRR